MAKPTASAYPAALDSNTTLFADPVDLGEFTLNTSINDAVTSFIVDEVITGVTVPTFMTWDTGEIIYIEAKTDGTKTFSSVTRGSNGTTAASHTAGEKVRITFVSDYVKQIKKCLVAIQTELGIDPAGSSADVKARLVTIDDFIATKAQASGLASLEGSGAANVVQNPASLGIANGVASLNASSKVVENPANATFTAAASKIPIADANSKIDTWISQSKLVAKNILLTPGGLFPRATLPAGYPTILETATYQNYKRMTFGDSAIASAGFPFALPGDYNGGTIYARIYWMHNTGGSGNVRWGVRFEGMGDQEALAVTSGTTVYIDDAAGSDANLYITTWSAEITPAGSPVAGELIWAVIFRNPTATEDTLGVDAYLLGLELQYTRT